MTGEAALAELDGWGGQRGARVRLRKEKAEEAAKQAETKRKVGWPKGKSRGEG